MTPPTESELELLVRRFSRLVRATAARVGGAAGREIAEDVEQNVFMNLFRQLNREQFIEHEASYIYRCAVRETVRLLSRRTEEPEDADAGESPSPAILPDEQLAARERSDLLRDAIKELPVDRRRAVQAYLAGFSVAETMKMYGWSYQRARNLSARGMIELRAALRKRGIDG